MTRAARDRRRIVFTVVYGAAAVALTLPVVPAVWAPRPLILGLPPALVWVIGWLAVIFSLVLWLYRTEPRAGASRVDR